MQLKGFFFYHRPWGREFGCDGGEMASIHHAELGWVGVGEGEGGQFPLLVAAWGNERRGLTM